MAELDLDVAVIGAGAAGLATAIFTKRLNPGLRVAVYDGRAKPGAKILVSGGSRCNVTNTVVTAADFNGGRPHAIALVLRALSVDDTIAFFDEIGVALRDEPGGKLFPVTNRSRDVLESLLRELRRVGAELRAGDRVLEILRMPGDFVMASERSRITAARIVIATGGLSLPKTGSNGWGYTAAARLGHTIVPTTPALVPLLVPGTTSLSGVSTHARIDVRVDGRIAERIHGSLLWTHFGVSGPAALDASRHWLRAALEKRAVGMTASLSPNDDFASLEARWLDLTRTRPRLSVENALAQFVPHAVATVLHRTSEDVTHDTLAELTRDERRHLLHRVTEWPLPIAGSRGYTYAEVTAGGVNLSEVSPRTMESRICPGLYLVGEVLDVDGRIGGFNFQWGWSSARAAAEALAKSDLSAGRRS